MVHSVELIWNLIQKLFLIKIYSKLKISKEFIKFN